MPISFYIFSNKGHSQNNKKWTLIRPLRALSSLKIPQFLGFWIFHLAFSPYDDEAFTHDFSKKGLLVSLRVFRGSKGFLGSVQRVCWVPRDSARLQGVPPGY